MNLSFEPQPEGLLMTIDGAFEDAVRRFPERPAVKCLADTTTYTELDCYAHRLLAWLRCQGVGSGHIVAIFLPRSVELVALLVAVARLGAVAAPLDSSMPLKRRDAVMQQLGALLIVEAADRGILGRIMRDSRPIFAPAGENAHHPDDVAIIFFTSGSTGMPKGVAVPHVGITMLMREPDFVPITPDTRIAHLANPAFDALSFDLWAGLLNGACVIVLEDEEILDPELFARRVTADFCDTAFLTTSLFKLLTEHAPQTLAGMKHLLIGGEAFEPGAACRLYEQCADATVQLYNAYGPTEFATFSLVHRVARDRLAEYLDRGRVPVGRPVRGTTPVVVRDDGSVAADGETGELFLVGPRIARGYIGDAEETALRFVQLDIGSGTPVLAYATGDRVRRNGEGLVDFFGRLDDQVKVRGHRIELGDVLSAILAQPAVVDAAVLPRRASDGSVALHAVVQLRDGAALERVRLGVIERLPPYMIPALYHCVGLMPLNRNGKADRRRLEALLEAVPVPADPGAGGVEAIFANAYREALGREPDLSSSFAEGGGHSLAAVRIAAAAGKRLGIPLRFTDFLQRRPLRAVLAELAQRLDGLPVPAVTAEDHEAEGSYPAASEQERLFFLRRLAPDSDAYNAVLRFDVPQLDEGRLSNALVEVQARNPLLSARFVLRERLMIELSPGEPVDFTVLKGNGGEGAAARACFEAFDPGQAGAWRVVYEKQSLGDVLWIALDHLVVDSWSLPILLEDLSEAYAAAPGCGQTSKKHPRPGHADYCRYRRAEAKTEAYASQRQSWKEMLARRDVGRLTIGNDGRRYPRPGSVRQARMTADGWARLKRHAQDEGNTAFASLMSAWVAVVCDTLRRDRLAVGFPISRRIDEDHAACVGLFAETLVGDFDAAGLDDFARHHARVVAQIESVFSRYQTSFADIVAAAPRGGGGIALFDSMLVLEDLDLGRLVLGGETCHGAVERGRDVKFPLTLFVTPDGDGAELVIEHDPEVVSGDQVAHILAALRDPLRTRGAASPDGNRDELASLLLDFAQHDPDSIALAEGGTRVTYRELADRVEACAAAVSVATLPEARVGILMESSIRALAALLGILKSARAYVPLDPFLPPARLKAMMRDVELQFTFCDDRHSALAESLGLTVVAEMKGRPGEAVAPTRVEQDWPAYVLFTSGSTGRPKGVEITRHGVANYLRFAARTYYAPRRAGIVSSPLTFDATLTTLLAPLVVGGTVRLLSPGPAAVPELATTIAHGEASVFKVTPSHLAVLGDYLARYAPVATPHVFVIGGEALSRVSARTFARACPNARLINEYGPTETVVGCTFHEVGDEAGEDVPIGIPIDDMAVEVVTEELAPVALGVIGELLIKGPGVAKGYVGRADLTAEKFVAVPGGLAYRSGDLGRIDPQGRLRYAGRRDDQVKIRGYRIELGEIETALATCQTVSAAAVLLVPGADGRDPYLAAFVAPFDGKSEVQLRTLLQESLPTHMLPTRITRLASLPLTGNKKIDRQALRDIVTQPSCSRALKAESK